MQIVRRDGFCRLYKGLSPAVVRQSIYGTLKYGLYYSTKDVLMVKWTRGKETGWLNILCAIFAGVRFSCLKFYLKI